MYPSPGHTNRAERELSASTRVVEERTNMDHSRNRCPHHCVCHRRRPLLEVPSERGLTSAQRNQESQESEVPLVH